jgi:hypothetical protein
MLPCGGILISIGAKMENAEFNWYALAMLPVLLLIAWIIYHRNKVDTSLFSTENLGKSFFSMGVLALILVGFVGLCVWILKTG